MRFRTASHLCMCGCGNKVVTPIRQERWSISYNGSAVSLTPSIGNWNLDCKSHYWLDNNNVYWSDTFNDEKIKSVKNEESARITNYYTKKKEVDIGLIRKTYSKIVQLVRHG